MDYPPPSVEAHPPSPTPLHLVDHPTRLTSCPVALPPPAAGYPGPSSKPPPMSERRNASWTGQRRASPTATRQAILTRHQLRARHRHHLRALHRRPPTRLPKAEPTTKPTATACAPSATTPRRCRKRGTKPRPPSHHSASTGRAASKIIDPVRHSDGERARTTGAPPAHPPSRPVRHSFSPPTFWHLAIFQVRLNYE